MSKRFVIILVAVAAVLLGVFYFRDDKAGAPTGNGGQDSNTKLSNHTWGQGKKGVTFIEYGDFQCPACAGYYPIVKEIKTKYNEDITFQFRHFPLDQIHPNARAAHRAAEAAAMQNKFWEMHDMLYERQQLWQSASNPSRIFEDYASELSLNIEQFKKDVASATVNSIINADVKAGQAIGATATPTFVLDGKKIEENPRDIEGFSKLIDEAIAARASNQQ